MSVEVLEAAHKCDVIMSTELQVQLINYEDSNKKYVSSEIDTNLYNTMPEIPHTSFYLDTSSVSWMHNPTKSFNYGDMILNSHKNETQKDGSDDEDAINDIVKDLIKLENTEASSINLLNIDMAGIETAENHTDCSYKMNDLQMDVETFEKYTHCIGHQVTSNPQLYKKELEMLPSEWLYLDDISFTKENIEPSLLNLAPEEETVVNNSIQQSEDGLLNMTKNYRDLLLQQHIQICCYHLIPCPYWHTQCNWIDILPVISQHIRKMHNQKIVNKKKAGYIIYVEQITKLSMGYKLIQQYKGRLYFISLHIDNNYVYITVQAICEGIIHHNVRVMVRIIVTNFENSLVWFGEANSYNIPIAHLWKESNALVFPKYYLNYLTNNTLNLIVEVDI